MNDLVERYEAARYSNDCITNSIKANENASFYLSSAMRQLIQENITAIEILAILRTLHDANAQILIANGKCQEASSELERKIL